MAVCDETGCAPWFEEAISSGSVTAGRLLCLLKSIITFQKYRFFSLDISFTYILDILPVPCNTEKKKKNRNIGKIVSVNTIFP